MARFSDKLGREWVVDVDMGSAEQVKQDVGVDLLAWLEDARACNDNRTVFRIVGSLVADQIAEKGLDARGFAKGFDGPALERAGAALGEALLFFTQPAKVARAALPRLREAVEVAQDRAAAAIVSAEVKALIERRVVDGGK